VLQNSSEIGAYKRKLYEHPTLMDPHGSRHGKYSKKLMTASVRSSDNGQLSDIDANFWVPMKTCNVDCIDTKGECTYYGSLIGFRENHFKILY